MEKTTKSKARGKVTTTPVATRKGKSVEPVFNAAVDYESRMLAGEVLEITDANILKLHFEVFNVHRWQRAFSDSESILGKLIFIFLDKKLFDKKFNLWEGVNKKYPFVKRGGGHILNFDEATKILELHKKG